MERKIVLALCLICFSQAAFAAYINASIINSTSGAVTNLQLDQTQFAYVDGADLNPDATLKICADDPSTELVGKYVSAVYKDGNGSGYWLAAKTNVGDLAQIQSGDCDAQCCNATALLNFQPNTAYFPARAYAIISIDATPSSSDEFIYIPEANGWLNGRYGLDGYGPGNPAGVVAAYNQTTGNVGISVTQVDGYRAGSYITYYPGHHGSILALVIGVCNSVGGLLEYNCSDVAVTNPGATATLNTSVTYSSYGYDNTTTNRSAVVNGIPLSFCMGPELMISAFTANTTTPYDSDDVNLSATVTNAGNVNVSASFNVTFYKDSVSLANRIGSPQNITGLPRGANATVNVTWDTFNNTGNHTIIAVVDNESKIDECNELNNNATANVNVQVTYFAIVWIDGVQTYNFTNPGVPYNVTVLVKNSTWSGGDWTSVPNATVKIIELNGISGFAPVQAWNESGSIPSGLSSYATASVVTNSSGNVSFALIPTGNGTFTQYSGLPLQGYVQDYSIYLEIWVGGARKKIYMSGVGYGEAQPLYITNQTIPTPTSLKVVQNKEFVEYAMNVVYDIYAKVKIWLLGP